MTATTITDATITDATSRPTSRLSTGAPTSTGAATFLQRWTAVRRHRRYLVERARHDARDRSDRYLERTDDAHQRQTLVAFQQR